MFLPAFALLAALQAPLEPPALAKSALPYDLHDPHPLLELPNVLVEISALTDVDSTTVACVQDEAASVYMLSLLDGHIKSSFTFGPPGDTEGLTRVGDRYFVLRSDGMVHAIRPAAGEGRTVTVLDSFRLAIPNHNIEGLGYDERAHRILVSPKDVADKTNKESRGERLIHAFNPDDATHEVRPVLRLSLADISAQATAMGIALPERQTPNGRVVPALRLRYSSVAVHPVTDHYYLLSAADRTLLVVDRQGRLVALEQLDAAVLPKPEGITFLANGDMILSSEGKGRTAVLARYRYQR